MKDHKLNTKNLICPPQYLKRAIGSLESFRQRLRPVFRHEVLGEDERVQRARLSQHKHMD